jgi:hypothetical protein
MEDLKIKKNCVKNTCIKFVTNGTTKFNFNNECELLSGRRRLCYE